MNNWISFNVSYRLNRKTSNLGKILYSWILKVSKIKTSAIKDIITILQLKNKNETIINNPNIELWSILNNEFNAEADAATFSKTREIIFDELFFV